jgi:hypothetical protein
MRPFMVDEDAMTDDAARARALAVVLGRSEQVLGLSYDSTMPLQQRIERVIRAAQSGNLDARSYRIIWWMRERHNRHG